MKKMLSVLTALAFGSTVATTVVACGTSEVDTKQQAIDNLSAVVKRSEGLDTSNWENGDKFDLVIEVGKAKGILTDKDASVEKINAAKGQLEWQINKLVDKYDDEASSEKQFFSKNLAWAAEIFNQSLNLAEIQGKDEFLAAINKGIEKYNTGDESVFTEETNNLIDATQIYIGANGIK